MIDQNVAKLSLKPGTVVRFDSDSFVIKAVIGSGGYGITYKAVKESDRSLYALKEYFPKKLCERGDSDSIVYLKSNEEAIKTGISSFLTEAERIKKLKIVHPNIVSVDKAFQANNTVYYSMEYVEGMNLQQYVSRNGNRPLSADQALNIMLPVLKAVALIHKHKLAHLDIKHENILLTTLSDGSIRPVLIDFGQSKHYSKSGKATSELVNAACSEGFSPPEQYLGLDKFTPQADVYAICATILYLLTAKEPLKSTDMSAAKIDTLLGDTVPEQVKTALIRGMKQNKDDRTQSVEQLASDLGLDLTDNSGNGSITDLLDLKKNKFDFSKLIKPGIAVVCCLGIGAGVYWFVNRPKPSPSEQLDLAIEQRDEDALRKFAEADSTRAFQFYAELLFDKGDYAESLKYAGKAYNLEKNAANPDTNPAYLIKRLSDKIAIPAAYAELLPAPVDPTENSGIEAAAEEPVVAELQENNAPTVAENAPARTEPAQQQLPAKVNSGLTDDELFAKAKTISELKALADKGYKKAYAPLAVKYLSYRNYKAADAYARRALGSNVGRSEAIEVVKGLDVIGFYDNGENGGNPLK